MKEKEPCIMTRIDLIPDYESKKEHVGAFALEHLTSVESWRIECDGLIDHLGSVKVSRRKNPVAQVMQQEEVHFYLELVV